MTEAIQLSLHPNRLFANKVRQASDSQLQWMLASFTTLINGKKLSISPDSDAEISRLALTAQKDDQESLSREETILLLGAIVKHISNIYNIAKICCPIYLSLYRELVLSPMCLSIKDIKSIIGKQSKVDFEVYGTGWNSNFLVNILLYPICYKKEESETFAAVLKEVSKNVIFQLKIFEKEYLYDMLFPSKLTDSDLLEMLPEGAEVVNYESSVSEAIDILLPRFIEGKFLTPGGQFSEAKCRKIPPSVGIKDFTPKLKLQNSRPSLIVEALWGYYDTAKKGTIITYEGLLTFMRKYFAEPSKNEHSILILLPSISGMKYYCKYNHRAEQFVNLINGCLKESEGKWIRPCGLFDTIQSRYGRKNKMSHLNLFKSYDSGLKFKPTETVITKDNMDEYVNKPFLEAVLAMFWAVGVVEFAFAKPVDSLLDATAFRLTDAGNYYVALTKQYQPSSNVSSFGIDDYNLVITAFNPDTPYCALLNKIATATGANRYVISAESIIRGSKNTEDAAIFLATLKRICPNPGPRMADEFEKARLRAKCRLSGEGYKIVRLNSSIPGLIQYIATNKEFAPHILKAENSYILVDEDYMDAFKQNLHQAGFIL